MAEIVIVKTLLITLIIVIRYSHTLIEDFIRVVSGVVVI